MQLIECSPNFSDGRRPAVLSAIVDAITACGVTLLGAESDAEQNRAVVRFVGDPEAVEQAASAAASVATTLIDMEQHEGTYPRIGAIDVVPLAPIAGLSMTACAKRARKLGERIATELDIPVYLYGEAALRTDRSDLVEIREGEYEGLRERIGSDARRAPDFGPKRMGPAGATAVGARPARIDVHLRLDGPATAARAVADAVAFTAGGLRDVEAWASEEDGLSTVFVRLRNPERTPLPRVFELARSEAERRGARLVGAALAGAVPESAIHGAAAWYLGLDEVETIEATLLRERGTPGTSAADEGARRFLDAVARPERTPAGAASAAVAGALAAALTDMVCGLTLGQARGGPSHDVLRQLRGQIGKQRNALLELVELERDAYAGVAAALAMPRATAAETDARRDAIQQSIARAADVPLALLRLAAGVLQSARAAADHGTVSAAGEAGVAAYLALAAARAGALGVSIHVTGLRDLEEGDRIRRAAADLLREAEQTADAVERAVRARIQA